MDITVTLTRTLTQFADVHIKDVHDDAEAIDKVLLMLDTPAKAAKLLKSAEWYASADPAPVSVVTDADDADLDDDLDDPDDDNNPTPVEDPADEQENSGDYHHD
jgi:hypothetical protein